MRCHTPCDIVAPAMSYPHGKVASVATKMILDCDTGVDDAVAIMYAALHPDIELLAVGTVWGNVDVTLATHNTRHVLDLVGRSDVPVARGAAGPLLGGPVEFSTHVHGDDGQGGVLDQREREGRVAAGEAAAVPAGGADAGGAGFGSADAGTGFGSAAQQIVDLVRAHPGEVWLVPVGPLTNIAAALVLEPELTQLVAGVAIMGGSARAPGNVTPVAEANIWHDPEAAAAVFRAPWPIVMAGLDVTMRAVITEAHRDHLAAGGAPGQYAAAILQHYGEFYRDQVFGYWACCMHDAIAVAAAAGHLDVKLAPTVAVEVDTGHGPTRGQTVVDLRGVYRGFPPQPDAHCTVLLEIDTQIVDDIVALIAAAQPGAHG